MERVNDIRAEIAENAAHIKNKMLLQELRDVSALLESFGTGQNISDETYYRISLIRCAVRAKNTEKLRTADIITGRLLKEWK